MAAVPEGVDDATPAVDADCSLSCLIEVFCCGVGAVCGSAWLGLNGLNTGLNNKHGHVYATAPAAPCCWVWCRAPVAPIKNAGGLPAGAKLGCTPPLGWGGRGMPPLLPPGPLLSLFFLYFLHMHILTRL